MTHLTNIHVTDRPSSRDASHLKVTSATSIKKTLQFHKFNCTMYVCSGPGENEQRNIAGSHPEHPPDPRQVMNCCVTIEEKGVSVEISFQSIQ